DEEATESTEHDLEGALFSFENENGTQRMFFTANGWLSYEGADGEKEVNNPSEAETGLLDDPNTWHYVALSITESGYFVYVDGKKRINETITDFDFSKIVQFMAQTAYLYIGYGSDSQPGEWWIDDIKIYRNTITSTQWADPRTPSDDEETDYNTYIQVGEEDCSTGWWTAFSDFFTFKESIHFGFYNYNDGTTNNWENWLLVVTNGYDRSESGYSEHFVLRSDAYGWGDSNYSADGISSPFDWDTFCSEMDGAYVDMTLTRSGNTLTMRAVITASSGTTYNYSFTYTGELEETLGVFLTCEGSYLMINAEDVYIEGEAFTSGSYLVGPADLSATWWTYFSDNYVINGNTTYPFGFIFTNNNSGSGNNWENWLLVCTNGYERSESGYSEYFVLRSDAYGWGDSNYSSDNMTNGFDWDTFVSDMCGAKVRLFTSRSSDMVSVKAKVRTAAGTTLTDYTYYQSGISTDDIGLFLTAEGSSLDITAVGYFPYADQIEK
ncbi:MAG: hypothetical protein Q4D56_06455, partial [Bacteroides sp.]|nr:hypothetical protein [Bacteroides sp.]